MDNRILSGEAFAVPLAVVLEVAVALLGEAEVLAVVVACEELPHHYDRPARLALGSPVCSVPPRTHPCMHACRRSPCLQRSGSFRIVPMLMLA